MDATERPEVTEYLRHLAAVRNYSDHTIVAYRHDLKVFAAFLDEAFPTGWDWETPQRGDFRHFLGNLQRAGRSKQTVSRQLAVLRSFVRFLRNHLDRDLPNIARQTRTPKLDSRLPKHLTYEQTRTLFRIIEEDIVAAPTIEQRWRAVRSRAICEVLYSTGARLSELCALDVDTVELQDRVDDNRGWAHILHGKRDKERWVPLGSHAVTAVRAWLPIRAAIAEHREHETRALFASLRGGRIEKLNVQRRVVALLARTGALHLSVHSLRHTMASHLLDKGASLRAVQAMLGHENIAQTGRYCHVTTTKLREVYMAAHPRAHRDGTEYFEGPACKPDEPEAIS